MRLAPFEEHNISVGKKFDDPSLSWSPKQQTTKYRKSPALIRPV